MLLLKYSLPLGLVSRSLARSNQIYRISARAGYRLCRCPCQDKYPDSVAHPLGVLWRRQWQALISAPAALTWGLCDARQAGEQGDLNDMQLTHAVVGALVVVDTNDLDISIYAAAVAAAYHDLDCLTSRWHCCYMASSMVALSCVRAAAPNSLPGGAIYSGAKYHQMDMSVCWSLNGRTPPYKLGKEGALYSAPE